MIDNEAKLKTQIDDFRAMCCEKGMKVTPQRLAVYKVLLKSKAHPSAEMVFRKVRKNMPNISLDTVNRTLLTLADIGKINIVEGSGEPKRFDAQLKNHQHFKCVKCRKIIDFYHKPFDDIKIPNSITSMYTVLRKTVYLEGICDTCRKRK